EPEAGDTRRRPGPRRRGGDHDGLRLAGAGPPRGDDRRRQRDAAEDHAQRATRTLPNRAHRRARRRRGRKAARARAPHRRGHPRRERDGRTGDPGGRLRTGRAGRREAYRRHPRGISRARRPDPGGTAHQRGRAPAGTSRPQGEDLARLPHGREHGPRQHHAGGRVQHLCRPRGRPRGLRVGAPDHDERPRRYPPGRRRQRGARPAAGPRGAREGGRGLPGLFRRDLRRGLRFRRPAPARPRRCRGHTRARRPEDAAHERPDRVRERPHPRRDGLRLLRRDGQTRERGRRRRPRPDGLLRAAARFAEAPV
ncbi:MAG: Pyrimidine-specific ribonucleoside hydrolase RihB, partial [uncultured Rubrobacteraceae bacterium]